jgi:hypothetical protein
MPLAVQRRVDSYWLQLNCWKMQFPFCANERLEILKQNIFRLNLKNAEIEANN